MTMTIRQARAALGGMVAVIPEDAYPAGRWTGARRRTLHNDEVRERAVAGQIVAVDKVDGKTLATVNLTDGGGAHYFYPQAIAGMWVELEQVRVEHVDDSDRLERAARAARCLGNGAAEQVEPGGRVVVVLSVEAAERIVRLAGFAATYLEHGGVCEAQRLITEIVDYAAPADVLRGVMDTSGLPSVAEPANTTGGAS